MGLKLEQFTVLLPRLIKKPSLLVNEAGILAEAIPMFGFLAPFGQLLTGPLLMNLEYRRKNKSPNERKQLVAQEFVSQCVTVSAHVLSFISGGLLARKVLPKLNAKIFTATSAALRDGETLACLMGGFIGGTFLRPILSAYIVNKRFPQTLQPLQASSSGFSNFNTGANTTNGGYLPASPNKAPFPPQTLDRKFSGYGVAPGGLATIFLN